MKRQITVMVLVVAFGLSSVLFVLGQIPPTNSVSSNKIAELSHTSETSIKWSPLVTAQALAEKISSQEAICLLEIGAKRESYDQGHIEGAQYVDWIKDITDPDSPKRYNILKRDAMASLMSQLGIKNESHVILYDRFASRLSTRMYWTLKVWGHQRVQILDGGFGLWAKNYPTSKLVPQVEATNYQVASEGEGLRACADCVARAVTTAKGYLIDGRPTKQFTGEEPGVVFHTGTPHRKRGHVPGAVCIPWKSNLNPDGTFKSADQLKALYAGNDIRSQGNSQPIITYCNEGLHAAMPWFVTSVILDFDNVSVYDDSMAEWANSDRPLQIEVPLNSSKDQK